MRPEVLNPLFAEVDTVKGVGPQIAKLLKRLGITRAVDLLYHLPTGVIERVRTRAVSHALAGRVVIVEATPFEMRGASLTPGFSGNASDLARCSQLRAERALAHDGRRSRHFAAQPPPACRPQQHAVSGTPPKSCSLPSGPCP